MVVGKQNEFGKWGEIENQEELDKLFNQAYERYRAARAAYDELLELDKEKLGEAGYYFGGIESIGEFGFQQIEEVITEYQRSQKPDDKVVLAVRLDGLSKSLEKQFSQLRTATKPEDKGGK